MAFGGAAQLGAVKVAGAASCASDSASAWAWFCGALRGGILSSASGTTMPTFWARSLTASTKPMPEYSIRKPIEVPCAPQPKQW